MVVTESRDGTGVLGAITRSSRGCNYDVPRSMWQACGRGDTV